MRNGGESVLHPVSEQRLGGVQERIEDRFGALFEVLEAPAWGGMEHEDRWRIRPAFAVVKCGPRKHRVVNFHAQPTGFRMGLKRGDHRQQGSKRTVVSAATPSGFRF